MRLQTISQELRRADSRIMLGAGLLLLAIMIAYMSIGLSWSSVEISWPHLLLVLIVLAPVSTLLSGAEYASTARLVGSSPTFQESLSIATISSAANLLPIPGSYLYRVHALRESGTTSGGAASAPLVAALVWVGLALTVLGVRLSIDQVNVLNLGIATGGMIATTLGIALARRIATRFGRPILWILVIETGMILVSAMRFHATLLGLGMTPTISQSLALAVSSVLGGVLGLFPAGLGIKELLAALIAPLVALDSATAILATVVNRILGLIAVAGASVWLITRPAPTSLSSDPPAPLS